MVDNHAKDLLNGCLPREGNTSVRSQLCTNCVKSHFFPLSYCSYITCRCVSALYSLHNRENQTTFLQHFLFNGSHLQHKVIFLNEDVTSLPDSLAVTHKSNTALKSQNSTRKTFRTKIVAHIF